MSRPNCTSIRRPAARRQLSKARRGELKMGLPVGLAY